MQGMYVAQWEDDQVQALEDAGTDMYTWVFDDANHSLIPYKEKKDPEGWAIPFVTGRKYRVYWGDTAIDFESMSV
jgi:hypothetical protein